MFGTLKTLIAGASARSEENLRDIYAIELIDQKIREATHNLKAAKMTLAGLIQRERAEARQIDVLKDRIAELTSRAGEALAGDREDLATQAAQAIADLENETTVRQETKRRLEARILKLRQSVETAHRRIIDLKQGAIATRAARREQDCQRRMTKNLGATNAFDEAEALIENVLGQDDPFEQGEILREIDTGLDHTDLAGRMADAGFGPADKSTAADVLSRLKSNA